MTRRWLEEAVVACGLSPRPSFPRNLADEVRRSLPVLLVYLPGLTCDGVRDWLSHRKVHHTVAEGDRPLHGCLVARAGAGILFIDEEDDAHEQRFTLAHEVAHLVLDHLLPRARAVRVFGEGIRPVLDGLRAPTPEEALSSVLDGISLGVQVRLMDRGASGSLRRGKVVWSEERADRLAFELLAPRSLALESLSDAPGEGALRLASRFGLPVGLARTYARVLRGQVNPPRFSVREFLGMDGR